jgi:hypothetical protein
MEHGGGWDTERGKSKLLENLEEASRCAERDLCRIAYGSDPATNAILTVKAARVAAAVHSLKLWIMTPKADTKEQFTRRVADMVVCVLRGHLDRLEKCEPPVVSTSQLWRTRLANTSRTSQRSAYWYSLMCSHLS